MTDNEIIKALECCKSAVASCEECPMHVEGVICHGYELNKKALDLITSQQVEIERLKIENQSLRSAAVSYKIHYNKARAEAAREFAERLKEKLQWDVEYDNKLVFESDIDNLVKEMAGDTE